MNSLIKGAIIFVIVLVISYFSAGLMGEFYIKIFPLSSGGYIDASALIGLPLVYTFFLTILFTAFGGAKKYWWIGIGLLPALAFELYFDLEHIYFPVVIGLLGWLIGYGLGMVVTKKTTQS